MSRFRYQAIVGLFAVGTALADTQVAAPAGSILDPHFAAGAPGAVAVALYFPATTTFKVQQWRNGSQVLTALPGKIIGLEYNTSGSHLLATYAAGGSADGDMETAVAFVSAATGTVVTTWPATGRAFHFGRAGTAVFAVAGLEGAGHGSPGLAETFTLSGAPVMRHDWGQVLPTGVVELGTGNQLVTMLGSDLVCVNSSGGIVWRTRLASDDYPAVGLLPFSSDFVLLRQDFGWFSLVKPDGTIAYRYHPEQLAVDHPPMTWEQFAQYEPHPLTATKIGLFDGTSSALVLDTPTWSLTPWQVNASVPPGYTLIRGILGGQFVLIGPTSFIIRSIPVP